MTPVRTVFMGSPDFAVPSLRALASATTVGMVVTQPDRPAGRGGHHAAPPVKRAALELGLDVFQPETLKDPDARERIRAVGADVIVVAAYGKILPRAVLDAPRRGCVNVHASLLPRWRGASPINAAILAGDAETGVTIMEMAQRMDAGPVISQRSMPIPADATAGLLEPALARLGAEELVSALPRWAAGELTAAPQDETVATYCWTLSKADGHLAASMTAREAERAVRAYDPWPGAYVLYRGDRLAIWRASVRDVGGHASGILRTFDNLPAVAFSEDWLVLEEVQKPGGRRISGRDFLNGERGNLPAEVALRE